MTQGQKESYERRRDDSWRVKIDGDVKGLAERMAGVESGIHSLGTSVDRLATSFDGAMIRQQQNNRTPWANYLAAFSVVLVVVAMFGSGYVRDINRLEVGQIKIRDNRISAADPVQNQAIELLWARLQDQQASQLRERALLVRIYDERFRAIERSVFGGRP